MLMAQNSPTRAQEEPTRKTNEQLRQQNEKTGQEYSWEQATTKADQSPEANNYARKIEGISSKIKQTPKDASLYVERAEAAFLLNAVYPKQTVSSYKLKNVLADMDEAIKLESKNPEYYALRGEYKRDINMDLMGAQADLSKAIELDPENPVWYIMRSNYKTIDGACFDWNKCAELGSEACAKMRLQLCAR